MKNYVFHLFTFLIFGFCQDVMAQPRDGRPGGGTPPMIKIKGKVVDNQSGQGLEFATISLYAQKDSSIVSGGITELEGSFEIDTKPGKFYAVVEFLSFTSKTISDIIASPRQRMVDLGEIGLESDSELLDEVEVTAEKSTTQFSLDKKVFNVGKDLARAGGTAVDVLENVPSLTVDIDGAVSLRGSQGVRILVDGKPSGLVGLGDVSGLRSFPANLIERVEIITNPSARYEAEGQVGIINIILKKDKKRGFNGSVDLTAGAPLTAGISLNLNYRQEKFNWFLNYGINLRENPGFGESSSVQRLETFDLDMNTRFLNVNQFSDQRRDHVRGGLNNSIRFGTDYYFTDKDILTAAFNLRIGDEENEVDLVYTDNTQLEETGEIIASGVTRRFDDEREDEEKLEFSINYTKKIGKEHEWVTDFRFQDNSEVESSALSESFFDINEVPLGQPDLLQRSNNAEGERLYILQSDYKWPVNKKTKVELGVRASLREIQNDYLVEEFIPNADWISLEGLSNNFRYDEQIYAGYAIYGKEIEKFSYQVGLRGEYTDINTELEQTNEENPRSYFSLFPSAHVNYKFSEKFQGQLSYSRRIRRPRFWDLNPFFSFSDARNFFSGNPDLDPEFTNAYEASIVGYLKNGSVSSSLYYRRSTDVIRRIILVEEDSEDNVIRTIRRPENLDTRDDIGLEVSGNYRLKKLNLTGNVNFFRFTIADEEIGNSDSFSWFGRLSATMKVSQTMDAQLSFNYRGGEENPQGSREPVAFMDLGLSKDILKNNATITLSVRDLFNSRRRRSTDILNEGNFIRESEFQWRSRVIQATFSYRVNRKKKRGGRRGGGNQGGGGEF